MAHISNFMINYSWFIGLYALYEPANSGFYISYGWMSGWTVYCLPNLLETILKPTRYLIKDHGLVSMYY